MWALLGQFRCSKCGKLQSIWQRSLRSPFRTRLGVCRECLRFWERTGHRCGQCWYPIQAMWDLGLLVDREVFAHVDCGGALLLPLGWSGRLALPAPVHASDAISARPERERGGAVAGAAGEPAASIPLQQ